LRRHPRLASVELEACRWFSEFVQCPEAVNAAAEIVALATDDAKAYTEARDESERAEFLQSLGLAPGEAVPIGLRPQVKNLKETKNAGQLGHCATGLTEF